MKLVNIITCTGMLIVMFPETVEARSIVLEGCKNKKHLKNAGPIYRGDRYGPMEWAQ